jgi:large subunit ribosomal protein L17
MRHAKRRLQLNRFTSWHKATVRSLARNVIINQSIRTTSARAKACRQTVEKLISLAKDNTLFARRRAQSILGDHKLVAVLFNEIGPRFSKRDSGFTRIISLGKRRGDDAEVVIFELTEIKKKETKKVKPAKAKEEKPQGTALPEAEATEASQAKDKPADEKKPEAPAKEKAIPAKEKKPQKKFIGGIRGIFRKKTDTP